MLYIRSPKLILLVTGSFYPLTTESYLLKAKGVGSKISIGA